MSETEWLPCLPWSGQEADLPAGGTYKVPGLTAIKFVKEWEVLDAESEEGSIYVKSKDLKDTDLIIGAVMNEKSINRVVNTYGPNFVTLKDAHGNSKTLMQWYDEHHTDGMELLAIREKRFGKPIFTIK